MSEEDEYQELLNIFLEEAQDLLDAISAAVQTWSSDLSNKAPFSDLKRDLHTLKGGARMVNQQQLSLLAHELESLCEILLSGAVEVDRSIYDLVCAGQDRMAAIVEALTNKKEPPDVDDLVKQYQAIAGGEKIAPVEKNDKADNAEASTKSSEEEPAEKKKPDTSSNDLMKVRAGLLKKLNELSIENNIMRVNLSHHVDNFNSQVSEMVRVTKTLQEKMRTVSKEMDLPITSEILGLINISKGLSQLHSNIESLLSQQSRVETELQDRLVDTRMIPFSSVIPRLGRIARQVASELKKEIDFKVLECEGEIDRNLLENVIPSIEHLLRNAIDHGVEAPALRLQAGKPEIGTISIRFFRMGNQVCIELSDDGSGISLEAIRKKAIKLGMVSEEEVLSEEEILRFIFEPGFSTRDVVSEISGRGVGMDVVNTVVKGLGGNLAIESKQGSGTKFTVRLPFTTSMNRSLLVTIQGETYGILMSNVERVIWLNVKQVKEYLNKNSPIIYYGNREYNLKYLGAALGVSEKPIFSNVKENLPVLLFKFSEYNSALLVDTLAGSQEVAVQSLGPQFKLMDIFSGATLLADGRVVVILDVYSITSRGIKKISEAAEARMQETKLSSVLVVDDSITIRTVTKNFLERNRYRVTTAKDGLDALEKMKEEKPDIILLDLEMPRMDGFTFAEKVRDNSDYAKIPIIMITFCVGEEQRNRALRLGVDKFIKKPYQEAELLDMIENLLGKL